MADVKRLAPDNQPRPTTPARGQHAASPERRRRTEQQRAGLRDDNAVSPTAVPGHEDRSRTAVTSAARRAVELVSMLSGRRPESVVSVERSDGGWRVGVEVVEVSRIPDSADILAVYEVRLDADRDLVSYRRVCRYARGHADREHQR